MVETLSMSCMQQQQQAYLSSPLTTVSPACKGVVNLHHHLHPSENGHHQQHHHHHHLQQHNNAMKSLTPEHDPQFGDSGDFVPFYGENMVDYDSTRMYRSQTGLSETNYDPTHIYSNGTPDCTNITASTKTSMVNNAPQEIFEDKLPSKWTHNELLLWIDHVCKENELNNEEFRYGLNNFNGKISQMQRAEFIAKFPNGGDIVYDAFHKLNRDTSIEYVENSSSTYNHYNQALEPYWFDIPNNNNNHSFTHLPPNIHQLNPINHSLNHQYESQYHHMLPSPNAQTMVIEQDDNQVKVEIDSEGESNHSYTNLYSHGNNIIPSVDSTKLQRRKPGRPPIKDKKSKNGGQRNSRLWEFIRDLLLDAKTCPSLLKWENVDEGIFRFVQSDKVARLWGERKCNPRMTYEKLSRAMRYYYKSQVFQPVIGRRLVYKFGPNATGWRPSPALYS